MNLDSLVRCQLVTKQNFEKVLQGEDKNKIPVVHSMFMDLDSIRECRLPSVSSQEWSNCYGPQTMSQYYQSFPVKDPAGQKVKVIVLKKPGHNLNQLSAFYGHEYQDEQ